MSQAEPCAAIDRVKLEDHPGGLVGIGAFPHSDHPGRRREFEHFDIGPAASGGPLGRGRLEGEFVADLRLEIAGKQLCGNVFRG